MHIDWWTLLLQVVNFLILIWLLSRFLYRPVSAIVRQRQAAAHKLLEEVAQTRKDVAAEKASVAKTREGFADERAKIIAAAHVEAEEERKARLAETAEEIARLRAQANSELARAGKAADAAEAAHAQDLAITIASRLLSRLPPGHATQAFVAGLCERISALPEKTKAELKIAGPIDVTAAAALDDQARAHIRDALRAALGTEPALTFRTDPSLIAGIALASKDLVLKNSWQEDLQRIREELARHAE